MQGETASLWAGIKEYLDSRNFFEFVRAAKYDKHAGVLLRDLAQSVLKYAIKRARCLTRGARGASKRSSMPREERPLFTSHTTPDFAYCSKSVTDNEVLDAKLLVIYSGSYSRKIDVFSSLLPARLATRHENIVEKASNLSAA